MKSLDQISNVARRAYLIPLLACLVLAGCKRELPHYEFILPDGYTGWIQVIFGSPDSPEPPFVNNKLLMRVDDSGVLKVGMIGTVFTGQHDEFFYSKTGPDGKELLVSVPANYVCPSDSGIDSCLGWDGMKSDEFTVSRANLGHPNNGTPGNSWFLFVGPPELRQKMAKPIHRASGRQYQIDVPEDDPTPGRIRNAS